MKVKTSKVKKACIFCKRSHMTCTDNRPCDRCIKRDIAHLCTDAPPAGATATTAPASTTSASTSASPYTSTKPDGDASSAPAASGSGKRKREREEDGSPSSVIHPPQSSGIGSSSADNHHQANVGGIPSSSSLNFDLKSLFEPSLVDSPGTHSNALPSNSPSQADQQYGGHQPSSSSSRPQFATSLSSPSLISPVQHQSSLPSNDQSFGVDHAGATSSGAYSTQSGSGGQQQQIGPSISPHLGGGGLDLSAQMQNNPFAMLNHAYDVSYPSNNSLSQNSLASLRLFATTADAQYGPFGTNNYNLTNGNLGMLNTARQNTNNDSDAGTGSDIDSTALDDFLKSLDEMYLNPLPDIPQGLPLNLTSNNASVQPDPVSAAVQERDFASLDQPLHLKSVPPSRSLSPILGPSAGTATPSSSTERFLLTAADQKDGTRDERLNKVIRAKYEAGLLKPFNYIKGYERLNTWMDSKWSSTSKHRTLKIISEFRPAFRAVAQSLTDMDLIYIEEAFERLLLDYDRVFSAMGIPACLWRRTGEIFKGNREFAELVGIPYEQLREGKLAISELMAEDSAVNFWEKYGSIAFDPGQKAVLTSCVLVNQAILQGEEERKKSRARRQSSSQQVASAFDRDDFLTPSSSYPPNVPKEALITCTFSFTIRRDAYHIPTAIVGNFMPYRPK